MERKRRSFLKISSLTITSVAIWGCRTDPEIPATHHETGFGVLEGCRGCKYTDCVEVCPVDAFREGLDRLVINPEICIHCGLCESECPIGAIKSHEDLMDDELPSAAFNAEHSLLWPGINKMKDPFGSCHGQYETDKDYS